MPRRHAYTNGRAVRRAVPGNGWVEYITRSSGISVVTVQRVGDPSVVPPTGLGSRRPVNGQRRAHVLGCTNAYGVRAARNRSTSTGASIIGACDSKNRNCDRRTCMGHEHKHSILSGEGCPTSPVETSAVLYVAGSSRLARRSRIDLLISTTPAESVRNPRIPYINKSTSVMTVHSPVTGLSGFFLVFSMSGVSTWRVHTAMVHVRRRNGSRCRTLRGYSPIRSSPY